MKNILEVMKQTNEMLPALLQWESTGEALTLETAEAFFQAFPNKEVSANTEIWFNVLRFYR